MVPRVVLASASPQRSAILAQLGVDFEVCPADVEELETGDPVEVARANAVAKASAVTGDVVLGVDTVVTLDGEIFGKPRNSAEARAMLGRLQGRTHTVVSGIAVSRSGIVSDDVEQTAVTFAAASEHEIADYVATGEWEGRAGGYAIQGRGAWLVERIEGDYLNVVGLPVPAFRRLFA